MPDVVIVPPTGAPDCDTYTVVAYVENPTGGMSELQFMRVKLNRSPGGGLDVGPGPINAFDGDYPPSTGTGNPNSFGPGTGRLALAPPNASGRQFLYLAFEGGYLYRYEIVNGAVVTVPDHNNLNGLQPRANAPIASSSTGGVVTFVATNELELSFDGRRLASGNPSSNKLYVLSLDPLTGSSTTAAPQTYTIPGLSDNRINGLEFKPGSTTELYVTAGVDGAATDGLFRVPLTGGGAPVRLSGNSQTLALAQSYIEADVNGHLDLRGENLFYEINPNGANGVGYITSIQGLAYLTGTRRPAGPRRLPHYIDGWNYGFGGALIGLRYVQVVGPGAATVQTYTASAVAGTSYVFTVFDHNGVPQPGAQVNGNQLTFDFVGAPVGAIYKIQVEYTSTAPCPRQGIGYLFVEMRDETLPQRPAPGDDDPKPEPVVWPNPATTTLTVAVANPAAAERNVTLLDAQGTVRLTRGLAVGAEQVELSVADLPRGLYLVRVNDGSAVRTRQVEVSAGQ